MISKPDGLSLRLKARLVADDAARQLHAAVENHFKAQSAAWSKYLRTHALVSQNVGSLFILSYIGEPDFDLKAKP